MKYKWNKASSQPPHTQIRKKRSIIFSHSTDVSHLLCAVDSCIHKDGFISNWPDFPGRLKFLGILFSLRFCYGAGGTTAKLPGPVMPAPLINAAPFISHIAIRPSVFWNSRSALPSPL